MAFVLITLTASLILNLGVLALLKIGLRNGPRDQQAAGRWAAGCQSC